jgi:hypothetical protein
MTDETARIRAQLNAARDIAAKHLYTLAKNQRLCELREKSFKRFDDRGFEVISLEVGRVQSINELLGDDGVDVHRVRRDARDDAVEEWRLEVWTDFLPAEDRAA